MINGMALTYHKHELRNKAIVLFLLLLGVLVSLTDIIYASGLGGYISEKLVERSGVSDSYLVVERSGVSNSNLDVAMGSIVSVLEPTNIYMDGSGTHAILRGRLSDLLGFPQATVWFEWGYDGSYSYSTTAQVVTSTGDYAAFISGFDAGKTVNYRFVSKTDGTAYSNSTSFLVGGTIATSWRLNNIIYPLLLLIGSIFLMFLIMSDIISPKEALIAFILVIFLIAVAMNGMAIVKSILSSML